ncbi:MAG: NADH:ubiquinone oxidoreductase subunit NDUFA12 [Alphaproteobacteria bacterium]|jgi:NADH:ubiquinone oxidoreductase subunit|nr:NADH:ubiquinone oxidoreductase subunit NDUFA12 [Alphaproteobacteria bacterium]MDP6515173.1 NADH:ubiquinone oxidoreductase subunit NDUFA12 [Alphaproteobacteria bacterium]
MGATFGTILFTRFFGAPVGEDEAGNRYFRDKTPRPGRRERRWVIYRDAPEASAVPPAWQGWLTHTLDKPPTEAPDLVRSWQKPHQANLTGTSAAYRPPGALELGGRRAPATGDYEPWTPD